MTISSDIFLWPLPHCYCIWPSHLHKGVAVQSESPRSDLFEAFAHVRQRARSQDLCLVVKDESKSHAEKYFGSLVEKTIPDPQNSLWE